MRTLFDVFLLCALATAFLAPSVPASGGGVESFGPAPDDSNRTLSLAITPPHVELAGANASASYEVRVDSNASTALAVDLEASFVTANWSLALGASTLFVPAGGNASTTAVFTPPANASLGASGRFELTARAPAANATATDSATARVAGAAVIAHHVVYGSSGTTEFSLAPRCSLLVQPFPGFDCGTVPLHGAFRCTASTATPPGAFSRVSLHFRSSDRVTTFHGSSLSVAGDVPADARSYVVQLAGAYTVTEVECAFTA